MTEENTFAFKNKSEGHSFVRYLTRQPSFRYGKLFLEKGGLREGRAPTVEFDSQSGLILGERSFRNITSHDLVVVGATHALGSLLQLPQDVLIIGEIAAYGHDATKPLEIVIRGYRDMSRAQKKSNLYTNDEMEKAQSILISWLRRYSLLTAGETKESFTKKIIELDTLSFLNYFDDHLNTPFLTQVLERTDLALNTQQKIAQIASSDTWGSVPRIISSLDFYLGQNDLTPLTPEFNQIANNLKKQGAMKDQKFGEVELLSMIMWYADAITSGDVLVSVDRRMEELARRVNYSELNEWSKNYYGQDTFAVQKWVNHAIEIALMNMLGGKINVDPDFKPSDLPKLVFDRIKTFSSTSF